MAREAPGATMGLAVPEPARAEPVEVRPTTATKGRIPVARVGVPEPAETPVSEEAPEAPEGARQAEPPVVSVGAPMRVLATLPVASVAMPGARLGAQAARPVEPEVAS